MGHKHIGLSHRYGLKGDLKCGILQVTAAGIITEECQGGEVIFPLSSFVNERLLNNCRETAERVQECAFSFLMSLR